jgi:hypothetical protein
MSQSRTSGTSPDSFNWPRIVRYCAPYSIPPIASAGFPVAQEIGLLYRPTPPKEEHYPSRYGQRAQTIWVYPACLSESMKNRELYLLQPTDVRRSDYRT